MPSESGELTARHTATIAVTPQRIFAALTDAPELEEWFAEHAEVQPIVGGNYHFWGKHTYGVASRRDATQTITAIEANKLLAFSWRLNGVESDVVLRLEPSANQADASAATKTAISVEHSFSTSPDIELIEDLWRMNFGNLAAHVTGSGLVRHDFTAPDTTIKLSIMIDAPVERVYRALTDPEQMNQWLAPASSRVDLRAGGEYSYGWKYTVSGREVAGGPTHIIDLIPNEQLTVDWPDWRGHTDRAPTQVRWLLEPVGAQTRVTLVHSGFARTVDASDYGYGWQYYLDALQVLLTRGSS
jgi:uncharacterized protein YndB with AHSA1/START domain